MPDRDQEVANQESVSVMNALAQLNVNKCSITDVKLHVVRHLMGKDALAI